MTQLAYEMAAVSETWLCPRQWLKYTAEAEIENDRKPKQSLGM